MAEGEDVFFPTGISILKRDGGEDLDKVTYIKGMKNGYAINHQRRYSCLLFYLYGNHYLFQIEILIILFNSMMSMLFKHGISSLSPEEL